MTFKQAIVWISHRDAQILQIAPDSRELRVIHSAHSKAHLHHKANTIGDGNIAASPDYFRDVIAATGACPEVMVSGPADAKLELIRFAGKHAKDFIKRIVKVETLDRMPAGELAEHAREFFATSGMHANAAAPVPNE